jgi:hypothetical protein
MTSIAPIATANVLSLYCFSAPPADYDAEVIAAYATGTAAAELARSFLVAGGDSRQVFALLLQSIETAVAATEDGQRLLALATSLHAGASRPTADLELFAKLCEYEFDRAAVVHEALVLSYRLDVVTGRADADDGVVELVRQIGCIAPFVNDKGAPSSRGRMLMNALRALGMPSAV